MNNHISSSTMGSGNMAMMGSSMGSNGGNIMDSLKNNLMTMLMFKSINGSKDGSSSSSQDMFYMMYIFILLNLLTCLLSTFQFIIQAVRTNILLILNVPPFRKNILMLPPILVTQLSQSRLKVHLLLLMSVLVIMKHNWTSITRPYY